MPPFFAILIRTNGRPSALVSVFLVLLNYFCQLIETV